MQRLNLRPLVFAMLMVLALSPNAALASSGDTSTTAISRKSAQRYARVVKPYGAAVRAAPDSDAPVLYSSECNDLWRVLDVRDGWVRITNGAGDGWIGGGRVALGAAPAAVDCGGTFHFYVGQQVETYVASGCLSLRSTPSRSATIEACVSNGHLYRIVNGPVDSGSGEDWFEVYSPGTGIGWVLADHLFQT